MPSKDLNIESWVRKKIAEKFTIPEDLLTGTMPAATGAFVKPAPVSKLRQDARLLQILAGVRRGDIAVEDAALEIIENRGLDRRSFLAPSGEDVDWKAFKHDDLMDTMMNLINCKCATEPQGIMGMPIIAEPKLKANEILFKSGNDIVPVNSFFTVDKKAT